MKMATFGSFSGIIARIEDFWAEDPAIKGCSKFITVQNGEENTVNFIVTPSTYFVDHVTMKVGDAVTGYYDANAPVPMIYPPQYRAIVMARIVPYQNVKVDYFNSQLISSDGTLKLIISPFTQIILENDQAFTENTANRNLIVVYGIATKSFPAQTVPYRIVVMCQI
jgi:hypothetical protein